MNVLRFVFCSIGFVFCVFPATIFSNPTPLDQNVFKSLKQTKLKNLKGTFVSPAKVVSMDYVLDSNVIQEVFALNGDFHMEKAKLLAHLPQTEGNITGDYVAWITIDYFKSSGKSPFRRPLVFNVFGVYVAHIKDVDLKINITMPGPKTPKMGLDGCAAEVAELNLDLIRLDTQDPEITTNLREWLRDAMRPSFSELFCDTMRRILDAGMSSPVVTALQSRMCSLIPCGKP